MSLFKKFLTQKSGAEHSSEVQPPAMKTPIKPLPVRNIGRLPTSVETAPAVFDTDPLSLQDAPVKPRQEYLQEQTPHEQSTGEAGETAGAMQETVPPAKESDSSKAPVPPEPPKEDIPLEPVQPAQSSQHDPESPLEPEVQESPESDLPDATLCPESGDDQLPFTIESIPLAKITISPEYLERDDAEERLEEMMESIEALGLLNPLSVARKGDQYLLVAGARRFLAARKLQKHHILAKIYPEDTTFPVLKSVNLQDNRGVAIKHEDRVKYQAEQLALWMSLSEIASLYGVSEQSVRVDIKAYKVAQEDGLLPALKDGYGWSKLVVLCGADLSREERLQLYEDSKNMSVRQLKVAIQKQKPKPPRKLPKRFLSTVARVNDLLAEAENLRGAFFNSEEFKALLSIYESFKEG